MGYADDGIVAINYKNKGVRILKKLVFNIYFSENNTKQTHKMCSHILILLKL